MRFLTFAIATLVGTLSLAADSPWVITHVEQQPAEVHCTHCTHTPDGYRWHYSNGRQVVESYADYIKRTDGPRLTCSTGYCSKASAGPVKPSGGCDCGCNAATCNCAHSPNVGAEPPGKVIPSAETFDQFRRRIGWYETHTCANGRCYQVWRSR